jgi:gliding motility-associated-like protein
MLGLNKKIIALIVATMLSLTLFGGKGFAQCPQAIDGKGNQSSNPYWISCSGGSYNLFFQCNKNVGAYTIDYGDGSAVGSGASLSSAAFLTHTYTATTDTFKVTFTETSSGCKVNGVVVMETTPSASIQIPSGATIFGCTPKPFKFQNGSTNVSPTTKFTWNFGDGTAIQNYDKNNLGQIVSHAYLKGTTNCNTAVTLTAENYCNKGNPSRNIYQPIQVWDLDNAAVQATPALLCFPDNVFHFDNRSNLNCFNQGNGGQRYEYWNFGNYWGKGRDSIVTWQAYSPPNRPGYTLNYSGIGTYSVMLIDSNFCGKDTAVTSISIVTPPKASFTQDKSLICFGDSVLFQNTSTGTADVIRWNFGDGTGWQDLGTGFIHHKFIQPGTFTITLAIGRFGTSTGCNDTTTKAIVVKSSPTANFSLNNPTACDSSRVIFTDFSSGAIGWSWTFGNGNSSSMENPPQQFYSTPNNYIVKLTATSTNGCTNTKDTIVYVYKSPQVAFNASNICTKILGTFTDQSTSSAGDPIKTWLWNFDDAGTTSTNQNPTHVYANAGTYNVKLSLTTAHCSNTGAIPIKVEDLPTSQFTEDKVKGCTPLPVNFTNQSSAGAISYEWDFGDGSPKETTASPSHTFVNITSSTLFYKVKLVVKNLYACPDTATQDITVYAGAAAKFSSDATPACSPIPVHFTNQSTGGANYNWNFGDGGLSTVMSPNHTFINATPYLRYDTVRIVVHSANGCSDSTQQVVTVYPNPNFNVTANLASNGCTTLTVNYVASSGGAVYNWDFGDGHTSTIQNPTHIFSNSGVIDSTYNIRLIVTNPFFCKDTVNVNTTVNPRPKANFSVISSGCQPYNASFGNTSAGAISYNWDFGDGSASTQTSPSHIFANNTNSDINFIIKLISTSANTCKDTISKKIKVFAQIKSIFSSDSTGCSPLSISFKNKSIGADSTYNWDFGDGSLASIAEPTHSFVNNTTSNMEFKVQLNALSKNNCSDTYTRKIVVYPRPTASFTASPQSQLFPSATVSFNNSSSSGVWNYKWNFGDTTTSLAQNPAQHTYNTWGKYKVSLILENNGCRDTSSQVVTIIPPIPIPAFSSDKATGCSPLTIHFSNSSKYATSYLWNFGDGQTSSLPSLVYTYTSAGDFIAKLTAIGPGGQSSSQSIIHVEHTPVAFFAVNPQGTLFIPSTPLACFNLSTYADKYHWIFGDGITSDDKSPVHYYKQSGSFFITLIAANNYGCVDTFTTANPILTESSGDIQFPNAFTPNLSGPNGGSYDMNGFTNDVFFPFAKGVEQYSLKIYNRWGELLFESNDLTIGWDGYYKGILCKQDVYIWKIDVTLSDHRRIIKAGDVTLLR